MRKGLVMLAAAGAVICMEAGCARRNAPVSAPSGIPGNQRVTIDFERFDEQKGTVWLRLSNWTAWDIRIPVEKLSPDTIRSARFHKDGAEAIVRYYLEEFDAGPRIQTTTKSGKKVPPDEPEHPPVPHLNRFDFLAEWWVPKKQSVIFQVPKEHSPKHRALRLLKI